MAVRRESTTYFGIEKERRVSVAVLMQANVPVHGPDVIDRVIEMLIASPDAESVYTLVRAKFPPARAARINSSWVEPYFAEWTTKHRSQDYEQAFYSDGAVTAMRRESLMRTPEAGEPHDYYRGSKRLAFVQPRPEYGIEIDDEFDFRLAEMFLSSPCPRTDRIAGADRGPAPRAKLDKNQHRRESR